MKAPMAVVSSLTERKVPRRMAWRVMIPKKISTMFSQEHPVGREVQGDPLVLGPGEPLADLGVLMGAVVVQHDVQVRAGMGGGDLFEEAQEFLVAVPGVAGVRGDLPGGDLQGGEQGGGAVPHVVVGAPGGQARPQRQHRGGPVQGLDLGLLIHADHHRALRRRQVQAR